jgi:hypothetical protein
MFLRCFLSKENFNGSVQSFSRDHAAMYQRSYELFVLSYNNSKTAERIFMKFGFEVMPSEASLNSYIFNFMQSVIS